MVHGSSGDIGKVREVGEGAVCEFIAFDSGVGVGVGVGSGRAEGVL